jgi:acyl dehydratase
METRIRSRSMTPRQVIARNHVEDSENRMHSDEVARRYGFRGGLVAGVTVYGYLTWPLTQRFGEHALQQAIHAVRLIKPAYDGETLRVEMEQASEGHRARSWNTAGDLLAELEFRAPGDKMPRPAGADALSGPRKLPDRPLIDWTNLLPMQPFTPWHWTITEDLNQTFAAQADDDNRLFHEYAHPHGILSMANQALMREYILPAWIHVSSEIRFHHLLRVNETVAVEAVPLDKWTRRGHEFVRLYVRFVRDAEVTTEIFHTAIFKVAT